MKKITFKLEFSCTVGWDDIKDTATLEVNTFSEVLEISALLKKFNSFNKPQGKEIEFYLDILDALQSDTGEEVMTVGEVTGIQCIYEDDKGVKVKMALSDDFGVDGCAQINNEKYENQYRNLLGESKKLAAQILKL